MKQDALAHILRASARVTGDPNILVIGSQSILGSYDEDDQPRETWVSVEADIAFLQDQDATKADQVDSAIGELSEFHAMYSYYAQGVELRTAILPQGWRKRVVPFRPRAAGPALAYCLEPHDLVVSKLMARREKDVTFASAVLCAGLVKPTLLNQRILLVHDEHAPARSAGISWLNVRPSSYHLGRQANRRRDESLIAPLRWWGDWYHA